MPVRWLSTGGTILCFHSLISRALPSDADANVPASFLRATIDLARRIGEIVPLKTILARHGERRSTRGLIAITFDDAYSSLLSLGAQILRDTQAPVTVFVVTKAAACGGSYWWDRVEDLYHRAPAEAWQNFVRDCGVPDDYLRGHEGFWALRQWILRGHRGCWPEAAEEPLRQLEEICDYQTVHRSMRFDELEQFVGTCTVEVGVHTVSHPVLPLLSDDEVKSEVGACYKTLCDRFGEVIRVLAFPYGFFDDRVVRLATEVGMSHCLTVEGSGLKGRSPTDPLPRVVVLQQTKLWKLALHLSRVAELRAALRRYGDAPRYPELPSATA